MLLDFLVMVIFVFLISALLLALTGRFPSPETPGRGQEPVVLERHQEMEHMEELAEVISQDDDLLTPSPPIQVPRMNLPGAKLGGGAMDEPCSKATGTIVLASPGMPGEKREYNRRLRDRRISNDLREEDRRMVQRRVWLRREEDRRGKRLLSIKDAADTLGVSVEQVYKWVDDTDIPFYHVTEGRRKTIRFDISELLEWYSTFVPGNSRF